MAETPKVEIAGLEKPLEVALEWKTARAIEGIDKAVGSHVPHFHRFRVLGSGLRLETIGTIGGNQ